MRIESAEMRRHSGDTESESAGWHSAVFRARDAGDVVPDPTRALTSIPCATTAIEPGQLRVWEQPVPGHHNSPTAIRVRHEELGRPLGPLPVRLVLLRYADGVVDLVVQARRTVADRQSLARFAAAVLAQAGSTDTDSTLLPAFGGSAGSFADPRPGQCRVVGPAPLPASRSDLATGPDLCAALAVVLSRFSGNQEISLAVMESAAGDRGQVTPSHPRHVRLSVAEQTVGALRGASDGPARDLPDSSPLDAAVVLDDVPDTSAEVAYRPAPGLAAPLVLHSERHADGTVQVSAWYRAENVPEWQAEWVLRCLPHVWQVLRDSPADRLVKDVGILGPADQDEVLALGRTPGPSSAARSIETAFAAVAAGQPDRVAIRADDTTLTYRQLDDLATRLAGGLAAAGVVRGDRVAVLMRRSAELVAVLLAVLRAGAAYVPFDPVYPAERLAFMADDAAVRLIVVDDDSAHLLPDRQLTPISTLTAPPSPVRPFGAEPTDDAYVIYTSGSTGRPKGVIVPHANVLSLIDGTRDTFGFTPEDVWSWFHSVAFDVSVWEIWGCLLTGGRLVVVPYLTARLPDEFRDLLAQEKVTVLSQTPSAFANLLSQVDQDGGRPADLRLVAFAGEPLDVRMLTRWMDALPEVRCRLVNMYGITETTVHSTAEEITRTAALAGSRCVGRAIPGWSLRVVDEGGNVLPPGCHGELVVGGDGVATGYLNRPELTAERFLTDAAGERVYRSGDRGRLLPDGSVEYLGRIDNQVKVRGYRIELDEIRSALLAEPAVLAAAVVVGPGSADQPSAELHAYVVVRPDTTIDEGLLRRQLANRLPDFMVPSTVIAVDELPLNPNGKLDPARLPARPTVVSRNAPLPGIEGLVLEVWRGVLGREPDPDGNFFDFGGNSLLAQRVTTTLREQGVAGVPVRALYQHPTLRAFTAYLRERTPARD
jgi:amino acid adenylation domain-containing protein